MRHLTIYIILIIALGIAVIFSLGLGAVQISFQEVLQIFGHKLGIASPLKEELTTDVLLIIRLPRVLLGILVGAALGIAGAAIQGVFRNPLAEPGLMGISAGASLFAVLIIAFEVVYFQSIASLLGYYLLAIAAFIGATVAVFIVYRLSLFQGKSLVATMLLAGIAINAFAGALTGLISYLATEQQLRSITFWSLGSLAGATWTSIYAISPFIMTAVIALPFYGRPLNVYALGESQAVMMGIDTGKLKLRIIIFSTLAVGAAVAFSGVISFVGLLVPHTIRLFGGVDNRYVIPASALAGAFVLTVADLVARILIPPVELPIGVITALIGTPVFLYILMRDKSKMLS